MGHPLSMDLRSRLLAAIDNGLSCRAAAARFGVAPRRRSAGMHFGATRAPLPPNRKAVMCVRAGSRNERRKSSLSGRRGRTFRWKNYGWIWPQPD